MNRFKNSLIWRATLILLAATTVVWLLFSTLLVWQANHMTNQILMRQHEQFTNMLWENLSDEDDLKSHDKHESEADDDKHKLSKNDVVVNYQTQNHNEPRSLEFAIYDINTGELINSSSIPALPKQALGQSQPSILNINHHDWFISTRANSEIQLVVASPTTLRTSLSQMLVMRIGWIALLGLLLLSPVLYLALRRGLHPITQFSNDVAQRAAHNLAPLQALTPVELTPLRERLNDLFAQVEQTIAREQRFTADAAHELRTPLAAIRLQLELAEHSTRPEIRLKAFNHANTAIERATHAITQLLMLARLDHGDSIEHEQIHLPTFIAQVLAESNVPAEHLTVQADCTVIGQATLLSIVFRNLIDNAILYGGEHTQVFVTITATGFVFSDTGKGISAEQQQRLGERFYRPAGQSASGAGLGWSIIKRIADLHHAQINIFTVKPQGLGVRFDFTQA